MFFFRKQRLYSKDIWSFPKWTYIWEVAWRTGFLNKEKIVCDRGIRCKRDSLHLLLSRLHRFYILQDVFFGFWMVFRKLNSIAICWKFFTYTCLERSQSEFRSSFWNNMRFWFFFFAFHAVFNAVLFSDILTRNSASPICHITEKQQKIYNALAIASVNRYVRTLSCST